MTDNTSRLWEPLRTHDNLADALPYDGRTMHLAPLSTFTVPVANQEPNDVSAVAVVVMLVLAGLIVAVIVYWIVEPAVSVFGKAPPPASSPR